MGIRERRRVPLAERVERVRTTLAEKDEKVNLGPSKITLKGTRMRLSEAIKALQTQSGNIITDLREANGAEATNPALDLDIQDKPFFEALDIIAEKAGVTINPVHRRRDARPDGRRDGPGRRPTCRRWGSRS